MPSSPSRRTVIAALGVSSATLPFAEAAAAAGTPTDPARSNGGSPAGNPSGNPAASTPRSGRGDDWMGMLPQHHRVDRSGGVVATHGERELVWEQVATSPADAGATVEATIEVKPDEEHHPLEGFGPALTHSAAWLLLRMPSPRRLALLREMFSPTGPLRLTALRIPIGTSDFAPASGDSTYYTLADQEGPENDPLAHFSIARDEDTILPVLREIVDIAGPLTVVMSPWSAPAWMKTSGSLVGGRLHDDEETRQLWAEYLARTAEEYEQAVPGLTVDALTVQNEPLHETAQYPCMGMTPQAQADIIARLLDELDRRGLETKVLSYDHNWDRVDYPSDVLDDLARRGVDIDGEAARVGSAFHAYAGAASAVDPLHDAHPSAPIWFTEQSGTQDPSKPYDADFADGIWWMSNELFLPALRHHHRGVILFNLVLDQDGGPGPATFTNGTGLFQLDEATGDLTPNAELYVMAHLSRFIPAGSPVLTSTASEDLPNVACRRPDGSVVVVLHNNAPARTITVRSGDRELTAALPGWTLATYVLTSRQQVRGRR